MVSLMSCSGITLKVPHATSHMPESSPRHENLQATAETVELSPPHAPKEEAIKSFKELEHELKRELVHLRHDHDKHEKEYFQAVVSALFPNLFFLLPLSPSHSPSLIRPLPLPPS